MKTTFKMNNFIDIKIKTFAIMVLLFSAVLFCSKAYCAVTYEVSDDGTTVTIMGTGAMEDYSSPFKVPWIGDLYNETIKKVIIEEGVTHIGSNAFGACYELEYVSIPGTVISIGNQAFYGCTSLNKITVLGKNESTVSIGTNVLYNTRFAETSGIRGEMYCYGNSTLAKALYENYETFFVKKLSDGVEIKNADTAANTFEIWVDTNEFGGDGDAKYLEGVTAIDDSLVTVTITVTIDPGWEDDTIVDFNSNTEADKSKTDLKTAEYSNISYDKLLKNYRYEDNERYAVFPVNYDLGTDEGNEIPVRAEICTINDNGDEVNYYSDAVWIN
ncbi:MAG: leucine-rich repeat protein [Clostridia bacterium]|nr:leucine-rich repeat protein [Clostridia bacterium]